MPRNRHERPGVGCAQGYVVLGMAKTRMINTRFWGDGYISDLDPIEKLLFLYLLTNQYTNICGAYELPLKTIAFETGIQEDTVKNILSRFSLEEKIFYIDGWVVVKNFIKHQKQGSEKVIKGIENAIQEVPESLRVYIGYQALSHSNLNPNSNSNPNSNPNGGPDLVNDALSLFKEINPSYKNLYPRKTQRAAAKRLLDAHGLEGLKGLVGFIREHQGEKYFPAIGTPCQLEDKWASLQSFAKRNTTLTNVVL